MNNTWLAVPETCYSVTEGSQNTGATKSVVRWWETKYRPRREWRWGFSNVRSGWVRVGHVSDSFYYDSIPRFGPVWEKEIVRLSCSALRWCLQLHGCRTGPAWEKEKNEKNETEEECTKPSEWKWSSMDRVLSLLTSRDRLREGRICMDGLIRQPYVTTWKKKIQFEVKTVAVCTRCYLWMEPCSSCEVWCCWEANCSHYLLYTAAVT